MSASRFALLAALVACGGGGGSTSSGPDGDVTPGDEAAAGFSIAGQPTSGVRVIFQTQDSTTTGDLLTGSNGIASAPLPGGGFVTAVEPGSDGLTLATYDDVDQNEYVPFEPDPVPAADLSTVSVAATITPAGGATSYIIEDQCDRREVTLDDLAAPISLARCGGEADFLITAVTPGGDEAVFVPGVALSDGSAIDLRGAYAAFTTVFANLTDLGSASVAIDTHLFADFGALTLLPTTPVTGPGSLAMFVPAGPPNIYPNPGTMGVRVLVSDGATDQTIATQAQVAQPFGLDVRASSLPDIGDIAVDASEHRITISNTVGYLPAFAVVTLHITTATGVVTWYIADKYYSNASGLVGPLDDGTPIVVALPALPTDVVDLTGATIDASVEYVDLAEQSGTGHGDLLFHPHAIDGAFYLPSQLTGAYGGPSRTTVARKHTP